jgi:hypothetical protein
MKSNQFSTNTATLFILYFLSVVLVKPAFLSIIKPSMIHADMIISTSDTTDDTVYLDVII